MKGLFGRFPELDDLSEQQRKKLFRRAYWRSFRHRQTWVALLATGILIAIGSIAGYRVLTLWLPDRFYVQLILIYLLQIGGMLFFVRWNMRITIRYMRAELPHCCLNCGYDLRASHDRCPECGVAIPNLTKPLS